MNRRHLALLALAACAGPRPGATRESRLRDLLDAHYFEAACDKVWPAALRVAADAGYPLAEADRHLAGAPGGGSPPQEAVATRALGGGRREAETGPGGDGRRFRIQADDDAAGCHVAYYPVRGESDAAEPDTALELALVRKVEPRAASAIEAQAARAPPPKNQGYSPRAVY